MHRTLRTPRTLRTHRTPARFIALALAAAIVATPVLAACGGGSTAAPDGTSLTPATDPAPDPVPDPPVTDPGDTGDTAPMPSRWDAVLDGIGDDGEVTLDLALDAFSLGVAPLPGNDLRRADTDERVPDATSAVAWVLRHFDELSAEQQAAVAVALSPEDQPPPTPGVSGLRATPAASKRASTTGCYGQVVPTADSPDAGPYRAVLDDVTAEIAARLGGAISLVGSTYLLLDHRDLGLGLAYTWADPGDCEQNGMASCTIHLSADAADEAPTELRGILAHEVMHCYQFQHLGMGAYEMPAWILEGVPAWVGEDISGGSKISTKWWVKYLVSPQRSLYGRDYDAIGFYAHLDEVGIDPWSHIVGIFDGFSNEPAFDAAGASSGTFLESWPSSVTRRTEWGRAWDATGPGITIDRATPQPMTVVNGGIATAEVGKVSNGLYAVSIAADIVTIDVAGYARMGADGGTDEVLGSSTTYCGRAGGCVCPDGSKLPYDQIAGLVTIGVTGGTQEASLTITGSKLDCEEREEPDLVDPCLVGTWVSTASYIHDTVTGAPVDELGGGAGIVMIIRADGVFGMDFNASTPSSTDLGDGLVLSTQTRGIATGHLTATGGSVEVLDNDYQTALTTTFSVGGSIAGGTGIGTGSYSCGAGTIEIRTPFELGETINSFTAA